MRGLRWAILVALSFALVMPAQAADPLACLTGTEPEVEEDRYDLLDVIAAVEVACPCGDFDGSKGKGKSDYTKCAAAVVTDLAAEPFPELRAQCVKTAQKMFKQSVCGRKPSTNSRPCISRSVKTGKIKCAIKATTKRDGVTPSASCANSASTTRVSCPTYNLCQEAADSNLDGLLAAPGDNGACSPPFGAYRYTCFDCLLSLGDTLLSCTCLDFEGQPNETSVSMPCDGTIENIGGVLNCFP